MPNRKLQWKTAEYPKFSDENPQWDGYDDTLKALQLLDARRGTVGVDSITVHRKGGRYGDITYRLAAAEPVTEIRFSFLSPEDGGTLGTVLLVDGKAQYDESDPNVQTARKLEPALKLLDDKTPIVVDGSYFWKVTV